MATSRINTARQHYAAAGILSGSGVKYQDIARLELTGVCGGERHIVLVRMGYDVLGLGQRAGDRIIRVDATGAHDGSHEHATVGPKPARKTEARLVELLHGLFVGGSRSQLAVTVLFLAWIPVSERFGPGQVQRSLYDITRFSPAAAGVNVVGAVWCGGSRSGGSSCSGSAAGKRDGLLDAVDKPLCVFILIVLA